MKEGRKEETLHLSASICSSPFLSTCISGCLCFYLFLYLSTSCLSAHHFSCFLPLSFFLSFFPPLFLSFYLYFSLSFLLVFLHASFFLHSSRIKNGFSFCPSHFYLFFCLSFRLSFSLAFRLFICQSACLSVRLYVCLSACLLAVLSAFSIRLP